MMSECAQVIPAGVPPVRGESTGRVIRSVRMPQNGQQPTKKPYTTPTLIAYGDVQRITEGGKGGTMFDSFPMRS